MRGSNGYRIGRRPPEPGYRAHQSAAIAAASAADPAVGSPIVAPRARPTPFHLRGARRPDWIRPCSLPSSRSSQRAWRPPPHLSRRAPISGMFKSSSPLRGPAAILRPAFVRNRLSTPRVDRGEALRRASPVSGRDRRFGKTSNDRFGFPYELASRSYRAAALVKGFGRRPLQDGRGGSGAGVRKPLKEETAGRKGRRLVGRDLWSFYDRGRLACDGAQLC
jgi:hypothetical protein